MLEARAGLEPVDQPGDLTELSIMPPKGKAEKVVAPVEDADPTEEEMQGKVVLTILLQVCRPDHNVRYSN